MLHYPDFNPIAFSIGPLKVHWYGIMYLIGIGSGWALLLWRARRSQGVWTSDGVTDLVFYCALGVILGGRLGDIFFYNWAMVEQNPWFMLKIWDGGMSFHGGLLGVLVAVLFFMRKYHKRFYEVADYFVPIVPLGLMAGRFGNFINGELFGRATDLPWGMVFPYGGPLPRHPSQLYEMFLEGVVLFVVLWWFSAKPRPRMAVSGLFLLGYGVFRFLVEFVRQPDGNLGFIAFNWLTRGQELSIPMVIWGIILLVLAYHHRKTEEPNLKLPK